MSSVHSISCIDCKKDFQDGKLIHTQPVCSECAKGYVECPVCRNVSVNGSKTHKCLQCNWKPLFLECVVCQKPWLRGILVDGLFQCAKCNPEMYPVRLVYQQHVPADFLMPSAKHLATPKKEFDWGPNASKPGYDYFGDPLD